MADPREGAVTLKDLYAIFADFSAEEVIDELRFKACLQRMGVGIPALASRIFHSFDINRSGCLDFRAFATGMSLICNPASAADRLDLTFTILDVHGNDIVTYVEIRSFVRDFLWAAMDVVHELLDTVTAIFQPPSNAADLTESPEFRRTVEAEAAMQVDQVADAITQEALSAAGLHARDLADGEGLDREQFRRWAAAQPRLLTWMTTMGQQWRTALAEQATSVARAAATATAQLEGDVEIDIDGVREVAFGLEGWADHAVQTLTEPEFAASLRKVRRTPSWPRSWANSNLS
jgi:Ca2+-binding EF-hand superfamily protein